MSVDTGTHVGINTKDRYIGVDTGADMSVDIGTHVGINTKDRYIGVETGADT